MAGKVPGNFESSLQRYDRHNHAGLEKGVERYLHLDFSRGKSAGHYIAQGLKAAWLGLTFFVSLPHLLARTVNRNRLLKQLNESLDKTVDVNIAQLEPIGEEGHLQTGKLYIITGDSDGNNGLYYAYYLPQYKENEHGAIMRYKKGEFIINAQREKRFIFEVKEEAGIGGEAGAQAKGVVKAGAGADGASEVREEVEDIQNPFLNKQELQEKLESANIEGTMGCIENLDNLNPVIESDLREGDDVFVKRKKGWQKAKYLGKYMSAEGVAKYAVGFMDSDLERKYKRLNISDIYKE